MNNKIKDIIQILDGLYFKSITGHVELMAHILRRIENGQDVESSLYDVENCFILANFCKNAADGVCDLITIIKEELQSNVESENLSTNGSSNTESSD